MKQISLVFSLLFLTTTTLSAKGYFKFTAPLKKAYHYALDLRLEEASLLVKQEEKTHPTNLMNDFIANYIDCIKIYISDNKSVYNKLSPKKNKRLNRIKKGDRASPYYLYTQAEIRLQWAILKQQFGENINSVLEMNKAHHLFEQNRKKFPKFISNLKGLGLIHAIFGAIPDDLNWAKNLLNFKGTIPQGLRELKKIATYSKKTDYIFAKEALMIYGLTAYSLGNDAKAAFQILEHPKLKNQKGPLSTLVKANFGLNTKHNDLVINSIQNCKISSKSYPCHQLNFFMGMAKLYKLDKDAIVYFKKFVKHSKGRQNIKYAYLKMAHYYLINGDEDQYWKHLDLCKTKGYKATDRDKKAHQEAVARKKPNLILLKSDLLFNGGYGQKALDLLAQYKTENFDNQKDKINYVYLKGRISQNMGSEKAISYFKETIEIGRNKPYYFACNAALQIGLIYENRGMTSTAKRYYNICLSIKPSEYRSSLHAKAKAGLNRLNK